MTSCRFGAFLLWVPVAAMAVIHSPVAAERGPSEAFGDADGNVLTETVRAQDAAGNALPETGAGGLITRSEWNALKKVAAQTDAAGRSTRYEYDLRGYETKVTHADGLFEAKSYDPNGNEVPRPNVR